MKVLVTAASFPGTNDPIGDKIYRTLKRDGVEVSRMPPEAVCSVTGFDAVVIGSALHSGRWLRPAVQLVDRQAAQLMQRKVWLFSSGSIDEPSTGRPHSLELAALKAKAGAVEHRLFPLTRGQEVLQFAEAAAVAPLVKPVDGAYDIHQIRKWATGIARTLRAESGRHDEWQLTV
ncbi:MAG: flavodoxin domain-containing protein [Actinomycetota bacterium]